MEIEIQINGQYLHIYQSRLFGMPDLSSSIEFSSFQQRCEYREKLAASFIEVIWQQLKINHLDETAVLYLRFRSNFEKPSKLTTLSP